ncbi:putative protein kinase RLK-Pelle-L-LEC family [Helianthus annuus]|nr:putative protein kinase RLK-Pelle-L-LEC family [Helianthus annuus]KAJ0607688.1 putative protein kinase RLK-Pelle-L-LEC family [Helianthus annuus]KAJ0767753.1 putative protein kinase RLK-Pelle-L-LEC family [Helianthus annuus]
MSLLTFFLLSLIPYAASVTFNFTKLSPKDSHDIIFSGDAAYSSNEGLQVTHKRKGDQYGSVWLAGRATYIKPLHLWDADSTDLVSFSTSFTFVIDSYPNNYYADGLTFFLAHNNSVINSGGILGLPFDSTIQTSKHRFVAVEFDTYGENDWDPRDPATNISIGDHVDDGYEGEELGLLEMTNEIEMGASMPRRFSYHQLARATANFAETEKLGEGGFGGVYKGFLKNVRMYVAVKMVSKTSKQGIKEYASEVRIISRLRHRNLVQLIGWCHDKGNLLLAYEFMENGSLDLHLFKGKSLLTWNIRYKIAHGLASALLYLHEEWEQCVLHRDIKSSNVMLDLNFNAKLGDFGLAKLVDHEKDAQTTMLAGTLGYMAPECIVTGKPTKESDVFSFGIVALEIACGRSAIDYKAQEKQTWLVEWVWELYGNDTVLGAVDPSLGLEFEEDEIRRLMILGLWCVHPDPEFRPSMRQAIKVLNSDASLPSLPSKMPVASYSTPGVPSLSDFSSSDQYQSLSRSIEPLSTDSSKKTTSSTNSSYSKSISVFHSIQGNV